MKKLQKIISLLLLCILAASTLLYSCEEEQVNDISVSDILLAAVAGYDSTSLPDSHIYMNDIINDPNVLDEGMKGMLFKGEYGADVSEMDYVESYAMTVPKSYNVFEIMIFRATDDADMDTLKTLLDNRLKVKNDGSIREYTPQEQPYLDNAEIHIVGKYAFLLATTDNDIAYDIINDMLTDTTYTTDDITASLEADDTPVSNISASDNITKAQSIMNVDLSSLEIPKLEKISDATLEKSELPTITVVKHTANTQIFVGGKCNENAVIHIKGGLTDMTYRPDDDNFMGVASIGSSGVTILTVTAQEVGKAESDPITITVRARNDVYIYESHGIYGVIVGNDFQGHFLDALDDYIGANLFSDNQKVMVENNIKEKVEFLHSDGLDAELIYLLIPNPMTIYPETVPSEYIQYTEDSRTKQFIEIAERAGATVIDLTESFMEHRYDEYKLFHKTDSHWTYYGAYIGYRDLFNYIGQSYPAALPRDESLFDFYNKEVDTGDMSVHQEFDETLLKENATFVNFLWDINYNPDLYTNDHSNLLVHEWVSSKFDVTNDNDDLPTAMVLRDSFGSSISAMISDRFSYVYWQAMWDYSFNKSEIKNNDPDYYIYVIAERNIKNVMQ